MGELLNLPEPVLAYLQNDEAEEDEILPEDSANDGFMVPDGQLSEDEGLSSMQQELDTLCADHEGKRLHRLPHLNVNATLCDCTLKRCGPPKYEAGA